MKLQVPLTPQYYLANYNHASLKLIGFPELGDLEKAVIGYVLSSSVTKSGTKYERSASYTDLRELVFEYFKMYYPRRLHKFVRDTRNSLAKFYDGAPSIRSWYKTLVDYFEKLETKPVSEIGYQDFETRDLKETSISTSLLPFRAYVKNVIINLLILGIFTKDRKLGRMYVAFDPNVRFKWHKKTKR